MSSKEFYDLSWWDWGMTLHRINANLRRRRDKMEYQADLTRRFMAIFLNVHRRKNDPIIEPEEIIPLSFDPKPEKLTKKEIKQQLGTRFKKDV